MTPVMIYNLLNGVIALGMLIVTFGFVALCLWMAMKS